jgi:short-subunit dehydrogenase
MRPADRWRSCRRAVALLGLAVGVGLAVYGRPRPRSFSGAVVLITGGSRGLGLELAREFGRRGARIAICARDADTLATALADLEGNGFEALAITADVRDAGQAAAAVQTVVDRWGTLDVLVNNAGTITVGPLETMTLADFDEAVQTSLGGAVHVTLAALPAMRARGAGHIVNIVSIGGKIAVPHLVPYSVGKFALAGFSEGLAAEARPWGIDVTTVYPGLMRTGSPRNARFKGQHRAEYAWFSIADAIPGLAMHVRRAARRIVDACADGELVVVLTLPARLAMALHAVFPRTTLRLLGVAARLLPAGGGVGSRAVRGRDSESRWSRSILTRASQRAERIQNQI